MNKVIFKSMSTYVIKEGDFLINRFIYQVYF